MSRALLAGTDAYVALFDALAPSLPGASDPLVRAARRAALERFCTLGFPTGRLEEWKKTDLSALVATPFVAAPSAAAPQAATAQVTVVNGADVARTSSRLVRSLAATWSAGGRELALAHMERAAAGDDALLALHAAFVRDGAIVDVPAGDVHVVTIEHLTRGVSEAAFTCPWTIVRVHDGARAVVAETHSGDEVPEYWSNAQCDVTVGANAEAAHVVVQAETAHAFHTSRIAVTQERDSRYTSVALGVGARLARTSLHARLSAPGAECTLWGLYAPRGTQHIDYHTTIDHAAPDCTSRELYHGILDDASRAVFHGRILVQPVAQRTNARQTNRNVLLSDAALVDTQPQLEIFANDVKCAHGATVGHMSEEALFYLRTRGLPERAARALLTGAFAGGIVDHVPAPVRALVDAVLADRVPGVREMGGAV